MKINGLNHSNNIHTYKKSLETLHTNQGKNKRDQLEISSAAKQLQQKSQFDINRQDRIDSLKAKIDAGQYQVDAYATAKRFYDFWKDR